MERQEEEAKPRQSEDEKHALRVLRGEAQQPMESLKLAKDLAKAQRFSLARRILGRARRKIRENPDLKPPPDKALELVQKHALYSYKDQDIPRHVALRSAWDILRSGTDLDNTDVKETLGIAGAIHKRLFVVTNQRRFLDDALYYYQRGFESEHKKRDFGYTGINAAFVHDYIAHVEERSPATSKSAAGHRAKATRIRTALLQSIDAEVDEELTEAKSKPEEHRWDPRKEWWLPATLAEVHLGLAYIEGEDRKRHLEQFHDQLEEAANLKGVSDWERESTFTQLSRLSWLLIGRLPHDEQAAAYDQIGEAMAPLIGAESKEKHAVTLARGLRDGKVGLALSGGGFRASLFHIGVLAKLAELDVLKQVEVLSCVSGGSILGSHYYLKLRKLLEEEPDRTLEKEHYIGLVKDMAEEFSGAVKKNIRIRVLRNPIQNFLMIFGLKSRTTRLAELFEKEIYSEAGDREAKDKRKPRYMRELRCQPADWEGDFNPRRDNWRRVNKVPDLVLNATTLNTGHNWQFTASWMGEPPEAVGPDIDANERLRRLYYWQAPHKEFKNLRLGTAVAASACVPGLFEPVSLPGLFRKREPTCDEQEGLYNVELVDGGVHDNQGLSALLGHDCDIVLVSDASGQMDTELAPSDSALSVLLRANSILMKRVRVAEYEDLRSRVRSGQLRGHMYIHLRSDLDPDPEDWESCQDPWDARDDARSIDRRLPSTRYGVWKDIQDRLSSIRTDLDSFSDQEAYALMLSGYQMTEHRFSDGVGELPKSSERRDDWPFMKIEGLAMGSGGDTSVRNAFVEVLETARHRAFKIWRMHPALRIFGRFLVGLAMLGLVYLAFGKMEYTLLSSKSAARSILGFITTLLIGKWVVSALRYESTAWKAVVGVLATVLGTVASWIHLSIFDPWFLKKGELRSDPTKRSSADPNT